MEIVEINTTKKNLSVIANVKCKTIALLSLKYIKGRGEGKALPSPSPWPFFQILSIFFENKKMSLKNVNQFCYRC